MEGLFAARDDAEVSRLSFGGLERRSGDDLSGEDSVDETRDGRDPLDFRRRHGETIGDDLRIEVGDIDEVGDPIQGNKHETPLKVMRKWNDAFASRE